LSCLGSSALRRSDCETWHSGGGWSPCLLREAPYKQADQGQAINAILGECTGRLRGQALFTPNTAPTCFGKDAAVRPPKDGQEAILPPVPQGAGGRSCAVPPSKVGAVAAGAACPSRGRWEKLRRSLLKGGSGCGRAACSSKGRAGDCAVPHPKEGGGGRAAYPSKVGGAYAQCASVFLERITP
jgi:hypothetical protein